MRREEEGDMCLSRRGGHRGCRDEEWGESDVEENRREKCTGKKCDDDRGNRRIPFLCIELSLYFG